MHALEMFSSCAQDAFGFPTDLQASYPDGNKAELEAVHKKVNLLYVPV